MFSTADSHAYIHTDKVPGLEVPDAWAQVSVKIHLHFHNSTPGSRHGRPHGHIALKMHAALTKTSATKRTEPMNNARADSQGSFLRWPTWSILRTVALTPVAVYGDGRATDQAPWDGAVLFQCVTPERKVKKNIFN